MTKYQVAQLNVGRAVAPMDDARSRIAEREASELSDRGGELAESLGPEAFPN